MGKLATYRASEAEKARTEDLLRLLPGERRAVPDVGAREGFFSVLLAKHFTEVTAVDLQMPEFDAPSIRKMAADATNLPFLDGSFDCVFCAEVLEHIPNVEAACREIARVARHEIVIGVPYRQDTPLRPHYVPLLREDQPTLGTRELV